MPGSARRTDRRSGVVEFLLLGVLNRGPAHGYALIGRLREQSDGAFDLAEGTIYPALQQGRADWAASARGMQAVLEAGQ
jgi:DNA-binding PadR family transcriptional regulator